MDVHPTKNGIFIGIDPTPSEYSESTNTSNVQQSQNATAKFPV